MKYNQTWRVRVSDGVSKSAVCTWDSLSSIWVAGLVGKLCEFCLLPCDSSREQNRLLFYSMSICLHDICICPLQTDVILEPCHASTWDNLWVEDPVIPLFCRITGDFFYFCKQTKFTLHIFGTVPLICGNFVCLVLYQPACQVCHWTAISGWGTDNLVIINFICIYISDCYNWHVHHSYSSGLGLKLFFVWAFIHSLSILLQIYLK